MYIGVIEVGFSGEEEGERVTRAGTLFSLSRVHCSKKADVVCTGLPGNSLGWALLLFGIPVSL